MRTFRLLLSLALFTSVFLLSCDKDYVPSDGKMANVAFAGRVVDENGAAVVDAQVRAGGESANTDINGVFRLKSTSLLANHAILSVTKAGFFEFSRGYSVQDKGLQTVTVQLLAKNQVGAVNGSSGGAVAIPSGAKLTFPANGVADASGNKYAGAVQVYARYLDPNDIQLPLHMPGDLTGINAAGDKQTLATFGMLGVELKSQSGQDLNVASGSEVEIRMPIPADKAAAAPAEIPLWHYDAVKAYWIEEGSAQKVGNEYVGKVKHFSFWNCDYPYALVHLDGKVYLGNNNQPFVNAYVRLTILSNGWEGFGYTDANGNYGGAVPKDEAMKLEVFVLGDCGNVALFSENIGPYASDATVAPIIVTPVQQQSISIHGKLVDCSGQPVANGFANIQYTDGNTPVMAAAFTDANGDFTYANINCSGASLSGTATGYDQTNVLESAAVSFSIPPNSLDLGLITVCTSLDEYIQFNLDGQSFTLLDPSGGVFPDTLGQGQSLTHLWAINSNDRGINIQFDDPGQPGTFPLTTFYVNLLEVNIAQSNLSTTVTDTGNPGGYMKGTFGTTFQAFNGSNHTISGSYRIKRDW